MQYNNNHPEQPMVCKLQRNSKNFNQQSSFEGSMDLLLVEEWIHELEKFFQLNGCEDNHKVLFATYILKGNASHQWEMTNRAQNRNGGNGVICD